MTNKDLRSGFSTIQDILKDIPAPKFGIIRSYNIGMREIYLCPDKSLTSAFARHKASVGILVTHRWRFPIGVEAYPWFANKSTLESGGRTKLTLLALKTAWMSPFVCRKNLKYQFKQALLVTLVIMLVQPLYEAGWQCRRLLVS